MPQQPFMPAMMSFMDLLVGIDASHAFERTHELSLKHTENLVYHYVQSEMVEG